MQGCKGHNSRSLKLKPQTADLLRAYLHKYTGEYPFPKAKRICEMWRRFRNRVSAKLNNPQIRQIPLRNLRHHYATTLYHRTKDILLVKQRLGHKKIETTMFYTQLITFNGMHAHATHKTNFRISKTYIINSAFFVPLDLLAQILLALRRRGLNTTKKASKERRHYEIFMSAS